MNDHCTKRQGPCVKFADGKCGHCQRPMKHESLHKRPLRVLLHRAGTFAFHVRNLDEAARAVTNYLRLLPAIGPARHRGRARGDDLGKRYSEMSEVEYDEQTCITAGELRAAGVAIPAEIPDCGWVPRLSVLFDGVDVHACAATFSFGCRVSFTEPFRWIEIDAVIDHPSSSNPGTIG